MDSKKLSKLRPRQVTEEYGIAEQSLANRRADGRPPAYFKLSSRHILYDRQEIEDWLNAHKVLPGRAG